MRAVVLEKVGSPDNFRLLERPLPQVGPDDVLIKVELAGMIYADAEARRGTYYVETRLPWYPGREAAGWIEQVGKNVTGFRPGQRVAALVMAGACYAQYVVASLRPTQRDGKSLPPADIVPLPDEVSFSQALVYLVNFRLAHFALHAWAQASPDATILIHGASGGMGSMLTQLAHAHGCRVIAGCRTAEEAAFCERNGADFCVNVVQEDYVEATNELLGGRGVDIVFNGVGGPTVNRDPLVVAPFGQIVLYGYVAGKQPFDPFTVTRTIALKTFQADDFIRTPHFAAATAAMYAWFRSGPLLDIGKTFPLEEVATAHRWLEAGRVLGKIALQP